MPWTLRRVNPAGRTCRTVVDGTVLLMELRSHRDICQSLQEILVAVFTHIISELIHASNGYSGGFGYFWVKTFEGDFEYGHGRKILSLSIFF